MDPVVHLKVLFFWDPRIESQSNSPQAVLLPSFWALGFTGPEHTLGVLFCTSVPLGGSGREWCPAPRGVSAAQVSGSALGGGHVLRVLSGVGKQVPVIIYLDPPVGVSWLDYPTLPVCFV